MKSKIMPTKTVYETTYTLKSGYHPHTHMLIGLNQEGINKTQIHKALNNNWRNYTGANLDVTKIDNPTVYVGGKEEYPEKLLEIFRQQKREMQFNLKDKQFPISRLETILMYSDQIVFSPQLELPHPRMHERLFVLEPLAEIESDLIIPGRGQLSILRQACLDQRVQRLGTSVP